MKQFLLLCLLTTFTCDLRAQSFITGRVSNSKNSPLAYASIRLKETGPGVRTDETGFFKLITKERGVKTLVISAIGYTSKKLAVTISDTSLNVEVVLEDEVKTLRDVVIIGAGTFEASDKSKGASLTPLDAVTVAGSGADIANSLRALPGVQQVGEAEGLFVRGGTSDEAKQFIDGVLLPNTNFSSIPGILQPTRVNPFLFKGILFSTGGYSALYGDALSSALILETVDLPERSEARFHLFPTSLGPGFQQLGKKHQSSWGINTSYSNASGYNQIVPQKPNYFHNPEYFTGDLNFRVKTSKNGILKFYTNYGYNHTGLRRPDIDSGSLLSSFEVKGQNLYSNLSYHEALTNQWNIDAAIGYNYNKEEVASSLMSQDLQMVFVTDTVFAAKNNTTYTKTNFVDGKLVLTKRLVRRQALHFGVDYINTMVKTNYLTANGGSDRSLAENAVALFGETDIYISKAVAMKFGLRSEYSALCSRFNLAPRISIAYKVGEGAQFNAAYGVFYQKPGTSYLMQNAHLNFMQATHYILNYQKKANNRLLRLEVFYKAYRNLVTTKGGTANGGSGYATGAELFFRDKKTIKNLDYWVSYSYLDTKRNFLNYPYAIRPTYTTPHTVSLAVKKFFPDLSFAANASYAFSTGRPYYDLRDAGNGYATIYDHGITNDYHNLNLSFAYLFIVFKKRKRPDFSGIGFGVNNALGSKQIFGYNYSYNGDIKVPITLPATRFTYIGLFTTFGTDKREDFIDQNL